MRFVVAMADVALASLDPRLQRHVAKAEQALARGQIAYGMSVAAAVLAREPGCAPVRRLLRAAQRQAKATQKTGLGHLCIRLYASAKRVAWTASRAAAHPLQAAAVAERALAADPDALGPLRLLRWAALAADWPQTAVQAAQDITRQPQATADDWVTLGQAHLRAKETEPAVAAAEGALRVDPTSTQAQGLLKDASVAQSLQRGWAAEETTASHPP